MPNISNITYDRLLKARTDTASGTAEGYSKANAIDSASYQANNHALSAGTWGHSTDYSSTKRLGVFRSGRTTSTGTPWYEQFQDAWFCNWSAS
jgi:hypothetical protein